MPSFRRAYALLILLAAGAGAGTLLEAAGKPLPNYSLSLEEFTKMAERSSLRSRIAEGSFFSSRWGWQAARRSLTWPTLNASAAKSKELANDDQGSEIDTRTDEGRLTLDQPMLTGTKLSLQGTWTNSKSMFDTVGLSTTTVSKTLPDFTASLVQPIYIFTGNTSLRSRRQADLEWFNNQDSYRGEVLSIEFDARSRYYDILLLMETVEVERKKMESGKLVNDATRALVRAGKLAEVEAVRSDIRSKKDIRRIQNAETALEKAVNEAKDFLYLPAEADLQLTSKLEFTPFKTSVDRIVEAAFENNPDILRARRNVELNEIDLKNIREGNRPQFNANGSYALTRNRSDVTVPLDPYVWTVGLGLDWPLFDAGQTRLKTRQSEVGLENQKRTLEDQLRQLRVDVENAYVEIKRSEDQIADFVPQKVAAQRNVNAIRLQYRNGLTRLTDVFDAENEMRDLDLEYLVLLVNFNKSRDQLKVLVGKDFE